VKTNGCEEAMRVTITTDGGFTGRGIGSASADVDDDEFARLRSEEWRDEYRAPGADLIRYTLTCGERTVSWQEGAEIPRELRDLFQKIWRTRA
jgi:hypothetical protein